MIGGTCAAKEQQMSEQQDKHLGAAVVTTSGRWPASGFENVPDHEKVRKLLDEAAKRLDLAGTHDWIATIGTKTLNADESFKANGFTRGDVVIDFGPRQAGGGCA
ncbi:MAG: hypothetical protein ABSF69_26470 [Polyangiaceae bacterium]